MIVVVVVCVLLPSYKHLPSDFPHVLGQRDKGEGVKRDGEGGRRIEEALGDMGYAFSISETPRVLNSSI